MGGQPLAAFAAFTAFTDGNRAKRESKADFIVVDQTIYPCAEIGALVVVVRAEQVNDACLFVFVVCCERNESGLGLPKKEGESRGLGGQTVHQWVFICAKAVLEAKKSKKSLFNVIVTVMGHFVSVNTASNPFRLIQGNT